MSRMRFRARLAIGLVALLAVGTIYATSFSNYPIIDRKHSVLADADAANFKLVVEEFGLAHRFGNEYQAHNRRIEDNAQKHKIHHILYAVVAHPIYLGLRALERLGGGTGERAVYAVNAVFTCVNIVLLAFLIRGANPNRNPIWPFLLLYAFSLSTWLYASVPESWPFSATLALAFILYLRRPASSPLAAAALLGVIMLNNFTLGPLLVLVWIRQLAEEPKWGRFIVRAAAAGVTAVGVWLGGLLVFSFWDASLRPDNFVRYTLWFRQFVGANLPPTSPYVWKSVLTNLYVNAFVSNQPDPSIPQEALRATFGHSALGTVAVLAIVLLGIVVGVRVLKYTRDRIAETGWRRALGSTPDLWPAVYAVTMVFVTIALFYPSGFLYSTIAVPLIVAAVARHLHLKATPDRVLLAACLVLVVANNIQQVMIFRRALAGM
ncbi:MAG: hypothetical protein ABI647_04700 [Gemmatimonadota bacterium]